MASDPRRNPNGTMRKGHSANPRGRPPRSLNMLTLFNEKRDEKIAIKVDGVVVKMTRMEAWVTNLWNKAIELDAKASATILAIMRASGQINPSAGEEQALDENSAGVLQSLIDRINQQGGSHFGDPSA